MISPDSCRNNAYHHHYNILFKASEAVFARSAWADKTTLSWHWSEQSELYYDRAWNRTYQQIKYHPLKINIQLFVPPFLGMSVIYTSGYEEFLYSKCLAICTHVFLHFDLSLIELIGTYALMNYSHGILEIIADPNYIYPIHEPEHLCIILISGISHAEYNKALVHWCRYIQQAISLFVDTLVLFLWHKTGILWRHASKLLIFIYF